MALQTIPAMLKQDGLLYLRAVGGSTICGAMALVLASILGVGMVALPPGMLVQVLGATRRQGRLLMQVGSCVVHPRKGKTLM